MAVVVVVTLHTAAGPNSLSAVVLHPPTPPPRVIQTHNRRTGRNKTAEREQNRRSSRELQRLDTIPTSAVSVATEPNGEHVFTCGPKKDLKCLQRLVPPKKRSPD